MITLKAGRKVFDNGLYSNYRMGGDDFLQENLELTEIIPVEKKFGETIRKLRIMRGLSQEELAFQAGVNRNYLSDVERGTRNISLKAIEKIAIGLELEIKDLF